MNWRPDGWNTIKILQDANMPDAWFSHRYACEAGADAMLEALVKGATKVYVPQVGGTDDPIAVLVRGDVAWIKDLEFMEMVELCEGMRGWLVFIPEEVTETPTGSGSDESPRS